MTWSEEWNAAQRAERITFLFVASATLLSILLTILNYPVIGHDAYVHLNWLYQFPKIFSQGIPYPRWLPESFGGFGAPTFYFYPPLPYWLASLFYTLGIHSSQNLYQAVQFAFSIISLFASYRLLKQLSTNSLRSLTGALLYSFLAYRFCDVFIRDALTEHAALAFLPLLFLRFEDKWLSFSIHTVGWAGIFLTNLPIAYLAIIASIITMIARRSYRDVPKHVGAFILAFSVSAIYLFPAFALRGLIHQRHLFDLPMHTSQFGFALLDFAQGHFDWLRVLSVAMIIASTLILSRWKKISDTWKWILAIGIFLQIPFVSTPIWHIVPGMPFVQFSFRWNGIVLLALAATYVSRPNSSSIQNCAIIGLAVVTIISALTISRNIFSHPPLSINSYLNDAPEYAPKWAASDPGEVMGITLRRMNDSPAVLLGLTSPNDSIKLISKKPQERNFSVHLAQQTSVRFHQWCWPHWKLYRDSSEIAITSDPNGFAMAELSSGSYNVKLKLVHSSVEDVGAVTSAIGMIIFLTVSGFAIYRSTTKRRVATPPSAETWIV